MKNEKKAVHKTKLFQSIKSKILLMGVFSIFVAVSIGVLGINSLNQNSSNSEIESIVNEIDVAQAKPCAGSAVSVLHRPELSGQHSSQFGANGFQCGIAAKAVSPQISG